MYIKTGWELTTDESGRHVLTRYRTPMWLWLLDRWFRIPDVVFDWIEWMFPRTSCVTRIPCLMYARWSAELIARRNWTDFHLTRLPDESDYQDLGSVTDRPR